MKHKKIYRGISLFFVFVMLFLSVPFRAIAADASCIDKMSSSDVVDDLETMGFQLSDYPRDLTADYVTIIDFLEFGYDHSGNTSRYALYLYVYNPSCQEIDISSGKNAIQLQTKTVSGFESGYRKYKLIHCDHTTDEGEEFLFYKFKIDVPQSYMLKPTKVNRIYDIADLEFKYTGVADPISFGAGGTWTYSGYQAYCGVDPSSPLSSLSYAYDELITLELKLNPATWKTQTSDKGEGFKYELFSLYFSVPDWIIDKYGNKVDPLKGLYAVDGVYTEYKVNGVVTSDKTLYNTLLTYVGDSLSDYDMPFGFVTENIRDDDVNSLGFGNYYGFNTWKYYQLGALIDIGIGTQLKDYDSCFWSTSEALLDTEKEFLEAIKDLKEINKFYGDRVTAYYKPFEVCADDGDLRTVLSSYISRLSSMSSWDKFFEKWNYGYTMDDSVETLKNLKDPLVFVPGDISSKKIYSNIENHEALYVSEADYSKLENFVDVATSNNESTYIMRFALRDFYSSDIYVAQDGAGNDIGYGNGNYFFEKRIFDDVDVLSLTWINEDGGKKIVPVSATPITIVGTPSPPSDNDNDNDKNDPPADGFPWMLVIAIVGGAAAVAVGYLVYKQTSGYSNKRKTNRRTKK